MAAASSSHCSSTSTGKAAAAAAASTVVFYVLAAASFVVLIAVTLTFVIRNNSQKDKTTNPSSSSVRVANNVAQVVCDPHDTLRSARLVRVGKAPAGCCVTYNKTLAQKGYAVAKCQIKNPLPADVERAVVDATGVMKLIILKPPEDEQKKGSGAKRFVRQEDNGPLIFRAIAVIETDSSSSSESVDAAAMFRVYKKGHASDVKLNPGQILILEVSPDVMATNLVDQDVPPPPPALCEFLLMSGCGLRLTSCHGNTWPAS